MTFEFVVAIVAAVTAGGSSYLMHLLQQTQIEKNDIMAMARELEITNKHYDAQMLKEVEVYRQPSVITDDIVTWAGVAKWLPIDIKTTLEHALTPKQRGYFTKEETEASGQDFVEIRSFSSNNAIYYPS